MKPIALAIACALVIVSCSSDEPVPYEHRTDWQQYFAAQETEGTFVLTEIGSEDAPNVYNIARARLRIPPADTYKLLASLIFLETQVVESLDDEVTWDGDGRDVPLMARTQTLVDAFNKPVDWVYEQLGDDVGPDRLEVWMSRAGYGNESTRSLGGRMWRDGTLTVTPFDQAEFMAELFGDQHRFDRYAAFDVMDLMTRESGPGWTMTHHAATAYADGAAYGWLIGSVETDEGTWAFAMNTDLIEGEYLVTERRLAVTRAILESMDILPQS
jgi:beta-lactamase class D